MSAARALYCSEILVEILEYFAPETYFAEATAEQAQCRKVRRATLAHAAQACKTFADPALNILWRNLDDTAPLLKVLPSFTAHPSSLPDQLAIYGPIETRDWARLCQYATRIATLRYSDRDRDIIHPATWTVLGTWSSGRSLFPRLRSLHGLSINNADTPPVILLSPSLRNLTVAFECDGVDVDAAIGHLVFQTLVHISPALQTLKIDMNGFLPSKCLEPLVRLAGLRELVIHKDAVVDRSFIQHLLDGPGILQTLVLTMELDMTVPIVLRGDGLRSLKSLDLCGSPKELIETMTAIAPRELVSLSLDVRDVEDKEQFTDALATCLVIIGTSLRSLALTNDEIQNRTPVLAVCGPALEAHQLTDVALNFNSRTMVAGDADLGEMARAWPRLVSFKLAHNVNPREDRDSHPTAGALVSFATQCPSLKTLRLPFVTSAPAGSLPTFPLLDHDLEIMEYTTVHGSTYLDLAMSIDRLFPNLILPQADALRSNKPWENTQQLLFALQAGRRQNRQTDRTMNPT